MSMRTITCPECNSSKNETLKVIKKGVGIHDINDKVRLRCTDCDHEWDDNVANDERLAAARQRGIMI